ncbi:hypothetical protein FQN57_006676 [Myotisia sp. PD_48]|nr:hypothetical protein FQN57_006676 [Myotisia sp. PD_48]
MASRAGMSLYANLLDPQDKSRETGTISREPVVFKSATDPTQQDDATAKKQQISAASLRFQPTKRPQLPSQKSKVKSNIPKPPVIAGSSIPAQSTPPAQGTGAPSATGARPFGKSTLADWANPDDDDINGYFGPEKRQRGGRKKRKKHHGSAQAVTQNWDDIYDPSRPNNYESYKHSEEKIREIRDWKDRLYAHRMARRGSSDMESDGDFSRNPMMKRFAPPKEFAPPPLEKATTPMEEDIEPEPTFSEAIPKPSVDVPDDPTGEDAYARRLRLSQNINQGSDVDLTSVHPPAFPQTSTPIRDSQAPATQVVYDNATISRAPVRYTLPTAPEEIPTTQAELEEVLANEQDDSREGEQEVDAPRSLRPGQKGFAERLMAKYGWTKGSGLGSSGSGIVKPLQVKMEKKKKKPDSEGGGFATPGGRGRIIGGARNQEDQGKFGAMSEVIILHGMVDGLDLAAEIESGELMQEIGEECNEKVMVDPTEVSSLGIMISLANMRLQYGRVERLYIDHNREGNIPVFVKFTNQLSALRAVNALEGRIFNGNAITARFFDNDKFEEGIYDE